MEIKTCWGEQQCALLLCKKNLSQHWFFILEPPQISGRSRSDEDAMIKSVFCAVAWNGGNLFKSFNLTGFKAIFHTKEYGSHSVRCEVCCYHYYQKPHLKFTYSTFFFFFFKSPLIKILVFCRHLFCIETNQSQTMSKFTFQRTH